MKNWFFLLIIIIASCVPPSQEEYLEINVDYKDPDLRHILDLQVKQDIDSLLLMTGSPNPTIRLFASRAFASVQSEEAYDSLLSLLNDPFLEVRTAAAFALGQLGQRKAETSMLNAFAQQDSSDVNNAFNASILEGIGKLGSQQYLEPLSTVTTYRRTDTLLLLGQARGIFQFGLREIFNPEAEKTMLKFLTEDYPKPVKKLAASYFGRFKDINIENSKFQLLKVLQEDPDPEVRMGIGTALTRTGDRALSSAIFSHYGQEEDYRVKVNILKQIHNFPYISVVERVLSELNNPDKNIALSAADYLLENGNSYDAPIYRNFIKADQNILVQIKVYKALIRNSGTNSGSRNIATRALKEIIDGNGSNPYIKAAALDGLAEDPRNYSYFIEKFNPESPQILQTKTIEGIVKMLASDKFNKFLRSGVATAKANIATFLQMAIESENSSLITAASKAFLNEDLNFKEEYDNTDFISTAISKLNATTDIDAYNGLNNVLAGIKGSGKPNSKRNENIKAINWELFDEYSNRPKAKIATTKGEIILELYKNESPLSVLNFIELSKSGFYTNKFFHRVIPSFVTQAGCPIGDGYGSLDYNIRSEFSPIYYESEGYLGYASGGIHTESSQWFITQSPTPHLDGSYTIFGKVIAGMEVVHNIELGDKINRIAISN